MSDPLSGIPVFVAAAETASFSAAAERLNLSRSAIGKTVGRLEARLGVRLFHRTTRSQSLTEDGQAFYERCLRVLDELRAAEAEFESGRREVAGRLKVSVPALFGRQCVVPILTRLTLEHPKLELDINFSDRIVALVEEGFDLAVRNGSLPDTSGLVARRVATHRMVVCAAPAYLQACGTPRTITDLNFHTALQHSQNGHMQAWRFSVEGFPPVEITPPSRVRFDDLGAIADAAVAGLGLAWLPCWLIRACVRGGELVVVPVEQSVAIFETNAVWPRTPHLPLRVRVAIDALAAQLPNVMGP